MNESQPIDSSIKAVVLYEIVKGIGAIIATFSLWMWHADLLDWMGTLKDVWFLRFGSLFDTQLEAVIRAAQKATQNWRLFLILIVCYAVLRFVEAYGLLHNKAWAYWFSLLGYGLFIPSELYYFIMRPFDWVKLFVVLLNILVVVIVYRQMRRKKLL